MQQQDERQKIANWLIVEMKYRLELTDTQINIVLRAVNLILLIPVLVMIVLIVVILFR